MGIAQKTHMDGDISVHTLWEHTRPPGPTVEWDGLNPTHWTTLELHEDRKNGGEKLKQKCKKGKNIQASKFPQELKLSPASLCN